MASKSLGTLTLDLIAKVGGFEQGLNRAGRSTQSFSKNTERYLNNIAKAFVAMGSAAIASTAVLVKSSIDQADATAKVADKLGETTEELSRLRYAAEITGVGQNTFDMALQRMTRRLAEARDGIGEAVGALQALGLEADQLSRQSPGEAFKQIADRMKLIPDQGQRVRLAFKLFDSEGVALVNTLNLGSEGIENLGDELETLGGVIDSKAAKMAEEFNDNLTRLGTVVTGTGNKLAESLLPHLVEFTDIIKDPETQEAIRSIVTGLADIAINAVKAGNAIVGLTKFLAESTAAISSGAAFGDIPRLEDELAKIDTLLDGSGFQKANRLRFFGPDGIVKYYDRDELLAAREQVSNLLDLSREFQEQSFVLEIPGVGDDTGRPDIEDPIDPAANQRAVELQKLIDSRIEAYEREIALFGETTEAAKLRYEIERGALQGIEEDQRILLEGFANQKDALEAAVEAEKERAAQQKERDALLASYDNMVASLERQIELHGETSRVAELRYDLEHGNLSELDDLQKQRLLDLTEEIEIMDELAKEEEKRKQRLEEQAKFMQEFGLEAARNIQSSFADFLFDPFEDGLDGMLKGFVNMIRRMVAELAAQQILSSLFGGLQNSDNQILSGFGSAFAGFKDSGGMIGAGQFGIVGELGPEIVRGPASVTGRQQTASMLKEAARSESNSYTFNFPNVRDRQEAAEAGGAAARQFQRVVQATRRYS